MRRILLGIAMAAAFAFYGVEAQFAVTFAFFFIIACTFVTAQPPGGGSGCQDNPFYESSCLAIFFNTTTNVTNNQACNDPNLALLAKQCPLSCNLCAQLGYNCNNTVSQNTCLALTSQCNSTAPLYPFMQLYCPETCALCPISGGGICQDTTNCSALAGLCNNPATFATLTTVCPSTCMRCPTGSSVAVTTTTVTTTTIAVTTTTTIAVSSTCVDLASNCAAAVASLPTICSNAVYLALMQAQCKKTCNFCTATSTTCVNTNSNCAIWNANGFCSNTAYTSAVKQANCALTCGLCTTG